jgi:hypothetical protein
LDVSQECDNCRAYFSVTFKRALSDKGDVLHSCPEYTSPGTRVRDCCYADGFLKDAELGERQAEDCARRSEEYSTSGADTIKTEAVGLGTFTTDEGVEE